MTPSFFSGDYVLVDKVSYYFRTLDRGEVIVFRNPENESEYFIKRVIGLPGEVVSISDGRVHVDGRPLRETYLPSDRESIGETDFILGSDEYFVMGDNRAQSRDSRSWGALRRDKVVGLVKVRFWPPNELDVFAY
ncbi:MAG: signal peptidase I [Parcubacteria group bacterium]|nr:signal peptidase I [Parcubacteria group bacterium]